MRRCPSEDPPLWLAAAAGVPAGPGRELKRRAAAVAAGGLKTIFLAPVITKLFAANIAKQTRTKNK